ncbi:hypothetical protein CRE_11504 [Caenorhabditis remanei]|uniref:Uncharacterized protein n=1 Tax=Caenorhabditis remanei TaxID=31234 RepID=E3NIL1_CAERE|nr:hypothetical protein CRE_11504 [Caenorhabditis remanei]
MVRETKAQADKKAADVERRRANRKQEQSKSGGDSQEPRKKQAEMSQEEIREYKTQNKRSNREKQKSLQNSQLSACSQETPLSELPKKRSEMSQEEIREYKTQNKRNNREKQKSLQSSQLSACSQDTQVSGGRKKIKDMNPDELRNYWRENREAGRQKGRTSTTSDMELSQRTSTFDFNAQHNSQFDMESLHSEMSDVFDQPTSSNAAARIGRKRMMSPQEEEEEEEEDEIPSSQMSTYMPNWSAKEKEEFKRVKVRYNTRSKKALMSQSSLDSPDEDQSSVATCDVAEPQELPEQQFNCKIRFALVDLLQVETDCIVFPFCGDLDLTKRKKIYSQFWRKMCREIDEQEEYKEFLEDQCQELEERDIAGFQWQRLGRHKMCFHIREPVSEKNKYTTVYEAQLRAAIFKCLYQADRNEYSSIAFPIFGHVENRLKATAITLQTIWSYFQVVRRSNLKLVYLATKIAPLYDVIGRSMGYIREIDLSNWNRQHFFQFEQMLFDKVKNEVIYSTVPGTDMAMRAFKFSLESKKVKDQKEKLKNLHAEMCSMTGLPASNFVLTRDSERRLPHQYISDVTISADESPELISLYFPMENVCGSTSVLRKLWVVSYYYMYYSDRLGDSFDFAENSLEHKTRKEMFNKLKNLHREVLLQWKRTVRNVCYKCKCQKPDGYHENLSYFNTQMSHPDIVFDQWILFDKCILVDGEDVMNLQNLSIQTSPQKSEEKEKVMLKLASEQEEVVKEKVIEWFKNVKEYTRNRTRNFRAIIEHLDLSDIRTGIDDDPAVFDDLEVYDEYLDRKGDGGEENDALTEAEVIYRMAFGMEEIQKAAEEVNRCLRDVALKRYFEHEINEGHLETSLRHSNNFLRVVGFLITLFSGMVRKKKYALSPQVFELWKTENDRTCTVDEFIAAEMKEMGKKELDLPQHIDTTLDDTFRMFSRYPKPIDLGRRTDKCYHCGALSFPRERLKSCCKNGRFWINPVKKIPPAITQMFQEKFRGCLISANAAFSMASVNYNRQQQKAHGVQSMKVQGVVTFLPSAIHPRETAKARYANFIVLEHDNETIASMRFESLRVKNPLLEKMFLDIQEYLDANNSLYKCFKSMAQLEKEELQRRGLSQSDASNEFIRFTILSPTELDHQDKLVAHPGVYAQKKRMPKHHVAVAISMNPEDTSARPRGLTIYPKNPSRGKPQQAISIYSDLCDTMGYPLLFPDAQGGYALHKYPRRTAKDPKPSYEQNIRNHIEELLSNEENPEDYYNLGPEFNEMLESLNQPSTSASGMEVDDSDL